MCTVSWMRNPKGYFLLCNRDELLTRLPAAGPRIFQRNGVSFVAPIDGDHGGSWIGVNVFGLALCLLNRYGDSSYDSNRDFISRGLLVTDLLECPSSGEIPERCSRIDLDRFRPFTLVALTGEEPATLFEWTGRRYMIQRNAEPLMPLTSSSLNDLVVVERRKLQFEEMVRRRGGIDGELLQEFHRSHWPEAGPYSVCMHREDAATVSHSAVRVTEEAIEFVYHPRSACSKVAAETVVLARTAPATRSSLSVFE